MEPPGVADLDDCTIRPYSSEDLTAAVSLWYRAWHAEWPGVRHAMPFEEWRAKWRRALVPAARIWVAIVDGTFAGYAVVHERSARLNHVVVAPECQRKGIGSRLLEAVKAACSGRLVFTVDEDNPVARAFYAGRGFVVGRVDVRPRTGRRQVEYAWERGLG